MKEIICYNYCRVGNKESIQNIEKEDNKNGATDYRKIYKRSTS